MEKGDGMVRFGVERGEVGYSALFGTPMLDLLGTASPRFFLAVLNAFSKYGMRLSDVKLDGPSTNPADVQVSCYAATSGLLVRFKVEHVQVVCDRPGMLGRDGLAGAIVGAMGVVREAVGAPTVANHFLNAGLHGRLFEEKLQSRLSALVPKGLEGAPTFLPSGVSFTRALTDGQGEESVVLERSLLIDEGAFLKITGVYPGTLSESDAVTRGLAFFDEITDRLHLEVDWGQ